MGRMMEKTESNLRDEMENVYIRKSKQIINSTRVLSDQYKNTKTLLK